METSCGAPRLFAPGPTYVPERIRRALAEPIHHHRTPEFKALYADLRARLRRMWRAEDWDSLVLCCSGTGVMEGAVVNFMRRDAKALVVSAGKFGERWTAILRAYGCEVIEHKLDWGKTCDPAAVLALVDKHPDVRAIYLTSADTSTGVEHPIEELGPLLRARTDALLAVDCICDFGGARDIRPLAWEVDLVVSCSQKCLMLPPGVTVAHIGPRAWKFNETADLPRFYFDWAKEHKNAVEQNITAWTSPVSLFRALQESLMMIEEEGLEQVVRRYARNASAVRAAVGAMGFEQFPERPTNALTVVRCPAGLDGTKVVSHLHKQHGLRLTNGQDQIKGKTFRIGHMGLHREPDILGMLDSVEQGLRDLGALRVTRGTAVAAATRSYEDDAKS